MKPNHTENNDLLHCKNCDGYYDPSLPNCPSCGEETANNLRGSDAEKFSVTQYGGGFGAAGSTLSRVALMIIAVLLVVALAAIIMVGASAVTSMSQSKPADSSVVETDPADSSSPAPEEEAAVSTSAEAPDKSEEQPEEEKPQEEEKPTVVEPTSISLNYYDLTLVNENDHQKLVITVDPADWSGELTLTTDNKNVVTIDKDGVLSNVGSGTCNVTISCGNTSATCVVRCKSTPAQSNGGSESITIKYTGGKTEETKPEEPKKEEPKPEEPKKEEPKPEEPKKEEPKPEEPEKEEPKPEEEEPEENGGSLKLEYTDITLVPVGAAYTMKVSGGNGTYTWSSADSSIASVDSSGHITSHKAGTTTVTVTSGGASAQIIVRVRN